MKMNKAMSILLIASQFTLSSMAFASGPTATTSMSPEMTLLEGVFAMQGQNLAGPEKSNQISKLLNSYTASAPADGRQDRMQQALVQLGVYTPAQAQSFMNAATSAEGAVRVTQATAADQTRQALSKEMVQLAQLHPTGAEFSACNLETAGVVTLAAGAATALAGLVLRYDNPSCYQQYLGSSDTCGYGLYGYYDSYGDWTCSTTDYYGPTICDQQDYYPHRSLGNGLLIGGGVAAAVGAIILIIDQNC